MFIQSMQQIYAY